MALILTLWLLEQGLGFAHPVLSWSPNGGVVSALPQAKALTDTFGYDEGSDSNIAYDLALPSTTTNILAHSNGVRRQPSAYDADPVYVFRENMSPRGPAVGGSESLAAEGGGQTLYRAVTDVELNSIKQTGQFSVVPGSSTPLPGVQGKWFYGSVQDARTWAGQAAARDGGPLTMIQTTVPNSVSPAFSQAWVDGIKNPALFYNLGNLNAPIKILPGTIP